jgi:pyruvate formate lyase activating enzyme
MKFVYFCKMVYNIQRFSTHDGEGIRTMIFYKGCPLRCAWCSNPESQSFEPEIMFDEKLCRNFGDCLLADPIAIKKNSKGIVINRSLINDPEKLRNICISKAITVAGENKSVTELLDEIEKDIPFYKTSKGGVTLSGGEPLSAGTDLEKLLIKLKNRNIDTAVETSLYVTWENIEKISGLVSTFLVDLKHINRKLFRKFTGGDPDLVFKNLEKLSASHKNVIIRIPVIPGFNHTEKEIKDIIDYISSLKSIMEVHFIPYHTLGKEKYRMLGMEYTFGDYPSVQPDELIQYVKYANSKGFKTKIGG